MEGMIRLQCDRSHTENVKEGNEIVTDVTVFVNISPQMLCFSFCFKDIFPLQGQSSPAARGAYTRRKGR
jgi:hypothetical protein